MADQTADTGTLPNVFPVLRYADATKALNWLEEAFGFRRTFVVPGPDDTVSHAQMSFGPGTIMLATAREPAREPLPETDRTADPLLALQSIYVYVEDVQAHADRARGAGAEITREPAPTDYGSVEYAARDFEGNHWSFGSYLPRPSDSA